MTAIYRFEVKGSTWAALGGEGRHGFVCIPADVIPTFSDAELAQCVRDSVHHAELAQVSEYVCNYRSASDRELEYYIKDQGEEALRHLELFERFAGEYEDVALVAARYRAAIERINKRVEARKQVKTIRRALNKDYASLFYRVGKRDGFKCNHCGAVDDLTLDHITPAIAGGESTYGNLQILCRSCNSRKGAK